MKTPSKGFLIAISCIVIVLCVLPFIQGTENSKSKYINGVLMVFYDFKVKTAAYYNSDIGKEMLRVNYLRTQWNESAKGQGYGIKSVVFGTSGEIVILSEQFETAIILTPNSASSTGWYCQTYPKVFGSTLCSKEN